MDVPIIGVPNPSDGSDEDRQAFKDQMSSQVPHVDDDPRSVWYGEGVFSQPTWVFVSANRGREKYSGTLGPQGLLEKMNELDAEAA